VATVYDRTHAARDRYLQLRTPVSFPCGAVIHARVRLPATGATASSLKMHSYTPSIAAYGKAGCLRRRVWLVWLVSRIDRSCLSGFPTFAAHTTYFNYAVCTPRRDRQTRGRGRQERIPSSPHAQFGSRNTLLARIAAFTPPHTPPSAEPPAATATAAVRGSAALGDRPSRRWDSARHHPPISPEQLYKHETMLEIAEGLSTGGDHGT